MVFPKNVRFWMVFTLNFILGLTWLSDAFADDTNYFVVVVRNQSQKRGLERTLEIDQESG